MSRPQPLHWLREHPGPADALLGVVYVVPNVIGLVAVDIDTVDESLRATDPLAFVLVVALGVLVSQRRRWPVEVLFATVALTVPYWVLDYVDSGVSLASLILLYTVGAQVARPRSLRACVGAGSVLTLITFIGVLSSEEDVAFGSLLANVVIFATAFAIGDSLGNRRAYLAEVEERLARADADRAAAATRAAEDERGRIARELHDVVAHSVSVIVIQAGAARRVLDRSPAAAADALEVIETTGRDSLVELRRLLGVLREDGDGASITPQPGIGDLEGLVQQWRDTGLPVELRIEGDVDGMDTGLGLTVFRIVQEALTNVMKHAGPARVEVTVRLGPEDLAITVVDDGHGPHDASLPSSGQGLIGMLERVELFGGTLETGHRVGGGFRVDVHLPVRSGIAS